MLSNIPGKSNAYHADLQPSEIYTTGLHHTLFYLPLAYKKACITNITLKMADGEISDAEKIKIASSFLLQSPPGEFNEVFNDVRVLLNNDSLLEKGCATAIADYNKDQFVPVKVEGADAPTLITKFNELQDDATDVQPAHDLEEKLEPWRMAVQSEVDEYIQEHFYGIGVATVFTAKGSLTLCIESHNFQPKNFWNGRWRSEWHIPCLMASRRTMLLISQKESKVDIKFSSDMAASAKELVRLICECESAYQCSIQENYALMSDTTFKALRRQLPITRSKLDWIKLQSYRVAQDIKPQ
uniref:F-actin-capping protein subunit alpha n=1 Tax=Ditylenchus dipsaci TaxID=166011 RepID=A0A915ECF8_9BILA